MWWTDIHDRSPHVWQRKFPLAMHVDDNCDAWEFVFSSGRKFEISDSCKMAMDANGPKYRPQEGESDPKKAHPKIAEEFGRNETWVKYRRKQ